MTIQAIVTKLKQDTALKITQHVFHKYKGKSPQDPKVVALAEKIVDGAIQRMIRQQIELDGTFEPL